MTTRYIPTAEELARRVAVAKDVLSQLRAERICVTPGEYLNLDLDADDAEDATLLASLQSRYAEEGADFRSVVDLVGPRCEVCARGALLLSKARCFNAVPLDEIINSKGRACLDQDDTTALLADTFDEETLNEIEDAFELSYKATRMAGLDFGERVSISYDNEDAELRLIAVMNNLIANGGLFITSQEPNTRL